MAETIDSFDARSFLGYAVIALSIFLFGIAGCVLLPIARERPTCAPEPATHELRCVGLPVLRIRMDGGRMCLPRGGEVVRRGARCVALPLWSGKL